MKKNTAVFLDRDGTINEEMATSAEPDQLRLIPGTPEAIRLINEAGRRRSYVTNQSGVAAVTHGEVVENPSTGDQ